MGKERHISRFAEALSRSRGAKLIDNKTSIEFLRYNSPADFLSWIRYADAVVTNSFHGTAFSVLMEKDAYFELDDGKTRNVRAAELLDAVGIRGREITSDEVPSHPLPIEYGSVLLHLNQLKRASLEYVHGIAEGTSGLVHD